MSDNIVSYETFRKFQRLEQDNDSLQALPEDFYYSFKEWLTRKTDLYEKTKDPIIDREIENAKKIIEDIVDRRQKKMLLLADHSSRSEVVPKNMLPDELQCFNFISNLLKEFKREIVDNSKPNKTEEETSDVTIEEIPEKQSSKINDGYMLLRVLGDVDKFVGTDDIDYGPLRKGDLITLPNEISEFLIGKELAERLEPKL